MVVLAIAAVILIRRKRHATDRAPPAGQRHGDIIKLDKNLTARRDGSVDLRAPTTFNKGFAVPTSDRPDFMDSDDYIVPAPVSDLRNGSTVSSNKYETPVPDLRNGSIVSSHKYETPELANPPQDYTEPCARIDSDHYEVPEIVRDKDGYDSMVYYALPDSRSVSIEHC